MLQQLVQLEHAFSCSMVVEIAQPLALNLQLPEGSRNLRESLDAITHQAPRYRWYDADGVVVFYEVRLHDWPDNPLNQKIERFDMPDTLSDLRLYLPTAISSAATGSGGFLNGLGVEASSDAALKKVTLYNTSARDILVRAIRDIGTGFSVIVFPSSHPKRNANDALSDWTLIAGSNLKLFKMYPRHLDPSKPSIPR